MLPPSEPLPRHLRCYPDADPRALLRVPGGKRLHFIRHGEALHQVRAAAAAQRGIRCQCDESGVTEAALQSCPYHDPELIDPPLTELGCQQVAGAAVGCGAELVLTAPTRRALRTAVTAFARPTPTLLACEDLRARISAHAQSRRRTVAELADEFPAVDFTGVPPGPDRAWSPLTESRQALTARVRRFLHFTLARPEQSIAVVTHFTIFLALFQPPGEAWILGDDPSAAGPALLDCAHEPGLAPLRGLLAAGETRSLVVVPGVL